MTTTTEHKNGAIAALAAGRPVFATWSPAGINEASALTRSGYDVAVFEMEHSPLDVGELRIAMQFLLDRGQIVAAPSLTPSVTPFVRIPANGAEHNQWIAKQVLDAGVYGVIWPHVSTVEQARNAVSACRYPRPANAPLAEPAGCRGDAPVAASKYWGLSLAEYYGVADVWPLADHGDVLVVIMIEDMLGVQNLPHPRRGPWHRRRADRRRRPLPGPRPPPAVRASGGVARHRILEVCLDRGVAAGHPHVNITNVEQLLGEGYRFLICAGERTNRARAWMGDLVPMSGTRSWTMPHSPHDSGS